MGKWEANQLTEIRDKTIINSKINNILLRKILHLTINTLDNKDINFY